MAESSIHPDDFIPDTTPPEMKSTSASAINPQIKFTSQTSFVEVLKYDLSELERAHISSLKKEVITDLALYILDQHYRKTPPLLEPTDNSLINTLQSTCSELQEQISRAEQSLLKRADDLEEKIFKRVQEKKQENTGHPNDYTGHHNHHIKNTNTDSVIFDHVDHYSDNFIDEETEVNLISLCEKLKFTPESGHGVCSFGEVYKYNRSKANEPEDIPEPIKDIIEKLLPDFPESGTIEQCLVNKFEGPDSFLPFHSDDEPTISPESSIYTLSLGSDSTIKFKHRHSEDRRSLSVKRRSLYTMSRKSQAVWSHGIDKSTDFQGVRYSITLRTVHKRFHRSTIILGDSNTKNLKFGKGTGTFGYNMPGKAIYCPLIENLDTEACAGYRNVIIHCGINNIKNHGADVSECAHKLINKVETIRSLCPNSKVTINPILPTKLDYLNVRCRQFNNTIFNYMDAQQDPLLQRLNFSLFLDERTRLLQKGLGRFNNYDNIHLGSSGIRLLVKLVKERVCGSRVDGRPYAGVSSMNSGRVNGRVVNGEKRPGNVRMMATTTTSNEFPALSQPSES